MENSIFPILSKLHKTGVKLEADVLYRRMGDTLSNSLMPLGNELVQELIQANILVMATNGTIQEYGLNPALASLVLQESVTQEEKDPTDSGRWIPDLQARTKWLERRSAA